MLSAAVVFAFPVGFQHWICNWTDRVELSICNFYTKSRRGSNLLETRKLFANRHKSLMIASPIEDEKVLRSRQCTQEGVLAGAKAAAVTCVASAVPTLLGVRKIPWAKANLNYTAQALIISSASIAAYFIAADKSILASARKNAKYKAG